MEAMVNKLRNWVRRNLTFFAVWMNLKLTRTYYAPGGSRLFWTRQFHKGTTDHTVWVAFSRDVSPLPNKYNTSCIVEQHNQWVLVNASASASLINIINRPEHTASAGVFLADNPEVEYVVGVPCNSKAAPDTTHPIIGPVTCTVLSKRLIGVRRGDIVTAEELLEYLRRNQWQPQQQS